jgi:actin related protein 2/3 complex subunit 3
VLIYITLFIQELLVQLGQKTTANVGKDQVMRWLQNWAVAEFSIPGDVGFGLNAVYGVPADRHEAEMLRNYVLQVRQETAARLGEKLFQTPDGKLSKWWLAFQKRKFMGKSL